MERAGIPAQLRRDRMLTMVREREFVRVADLSDLFGISAVTVRADLASLADSGLIQRVHGGAVVRDPELRPERSFEESLDAYTDEKDLIGRHAAGAIRSGETVILDVGTSTTAIARAIVARQELTDVVVFTSSLTIALELEPAIPRVSVVVTGGTLRPKQHSLVDPMAGLLFDNISASTTFIGCNGIHPDAGVTNVNLPEAAMKQRMIAAGQRTVAVADGSKLGNISVVKIADLSDIDLLITSDTAPSGVVEELESAGLSVQIAKSDGRVTPIAGRRSGEQSPTQSGGRQ